MPSRRELANAIRALSMDAVQMANSGHPGAPMGMADIAEVLWNDFLRHNPANPSWIDRDRFVLSNGHGSMLLYSLLHLAGYDLSIDDLKSFRQLNSKTPGHPELGFAPGVETTTGPLGQGLANAVGMAIAERNLAAEFNRPGHNLVDHHTYVFVGDGDLMEGISHEVSSLAGTLRLGKLIAIYDDNGVSIDGHVGSWFTDDTPARFSAYGWHVVSNVDGHDPNDVKQAIEQARAVGDRPSIICCKTVIGYGAPNKAGTAGVHGAPLGDAEIAAARDRLGWPHPAFEIPEEINKAWDARTRGAAIEQVWNELLTSYRSEYPDLAVELQRRMAGELPPNWSDESGAVVRRADEKGESIATRTASQRALNGYGPLLPELFGGSADLTGSNNTNWQGSVVIDATDNVGNYLHYGVREFGMAAIMNGVALHGGYIPYGGTFLVFSDYARNAVRLSALMGLRVAFVFTHDSIGLGEDGPTHQPVEHLWSLRLMPNLAVWRPCDAVETAAAWKSALERGAGPTALILTRQGLPHIVRNNEQLAMIERGGYVLVDCEGEPEAIVIATGSEVGVAVQAAERVTQDGRRIRVVSMPSVNTFDAQSLDYRERVLPARVTCRLAVEAGTTAPWYKYVGTHGKVIGLDRFGESAPGDELMTHFGFTVESVADALQMLLY